MARGVLRRLRARLDTGGAGALHQGAAARRGGSAYVTRAAGVAVSLGAANQDDVVDRAVRNALQLQCVRDKHFSESVPAAISRARLEGREHAFGGVAGS